MAKTNSIKSQRIEHISRNLSDIAGLAMAVRTLSIMLIDGEDDDGSIGLAITMLAERSGLLADQAIDLLGNRAGGLVVGKDFSDWRDLGRQDPITGKAAA